MEDTRSRWQRAYLEAMDYDIWGQVCCCAQLLTYLSANMDVRRNLDALKQVEEAIEGWQRLQVASAAVSFL